MTHSQKSPPRGFLSIFSLWAVLFFLAAPVPVHADATNAEGKLWAAVTYLKSVPEIGWIEIAGQDIILGWEGYPPRFSLINKVAARKASKSVRGEVRVYSVKAIMKGWRPAEDAPPHLCHSSAEGGRLKFSNCR